jgi:hypothetical protein
MEMYSGKQLILVLNQDCNCTAEQVSDHLDAAGYSVMRSFDLISAQQGCSNCNCQLIILLVYGQDGPPATLIFDGTKFSTSIFLDNDPERTLGARISALLSKIPGMEQSPESKPNMDINSPSSNSSCLCDK